MKGFALGLALKQRRKATRKSPINTTWTLMDYVQGGRVAYTGKLSTEEELPTGETVHCTGPTYGMKIREDVNM